MEQIGSHLTAVYDIQYFKIFGQFLSVNGGRQHMALISVSPGPYTIFVTTLNHDKEGTTLLRISVDGLSSDVCNADVSNWLVRRLASGTYPS
jgi:hypothetical protein